MTASPGRRPALCVFCGSRAGDDPRWAAQARAFGAAVARRGWALVYGGGCIGLMGELADGALAERGEVIGVIPRELMSRELGHPGLSRLEVVDDMALRKIRMIELSDAFVALPGGLGTLDELFEVMTLRQIGTHAKPIGVYDQAGYWQPLLRLCAWMTDAGFVHPRDIATLLVRETIDDTLDALELAVAAGREVPRAPAASA